MKKLKDFFFGDESIFSPKGQVIFMAFVDIMSLSLLVVMIYLAFFC